MEFFNYGRNQPDHGNSKTHNIKQILYMRTTINPCGVNPFRLSRTFHYIWGCQVIPKVFCKMPARRPIYFGYMPKTNQIVGKAYCTSLNWRSEARFGLPSTKQKMRTKSENLTLIEDKRSTYLKVQKRFAFLYRKILKKHFLGKVYRLQKNIF